MEQLSSRDQVIQAVEALQLAEKWFLQANAQLGQAKSAGSATSTLKARAEHEAVTERLLECAATAEESLASYRQESDDRYHKSIQDATTNSRRLHAERLALEEQLANLKGEIVLVEEREAPAVAAAVEAQQTASIFANDWGNVVRDAVRLTQQVAA